MDPKSGKFRPGQEHPNSKLTPVKVRAIRLKRKAGMTLAMIGRQYGLHEGSVCDICNYRAWKHVE